MAIEDAAALAACLRRITDKSMLGQAVDVFQMVRIPRVKQIHEASTLHDFTMHLPDGAEQRARDAAMEKEVAGEHFNESPNQWSDPTMQNWIYTYDPTEHIRQVWDL
jgi:salicylate hydroxylase